MKRLCLVIFLLAAAAFFGACPAPAGNSPAANNATNAANAANTNTAKPVAAAPTKDAIVALEKSSWEAWKNKDLKFFDGSYSDKYIGFGPTGRTDKAAAIKSFAESKTEVKSYSLSNEQMTMLGADAALLTFKAAQDYTTDGKPGPKEVWASTVYVRDGDKWKCAYYNETAVIDPKAPAKPAAAKPAAPTKPATDAKPADAATEALMALEKKGWEAWKARDAKGVDGLMTKDFSVIDSGQRFDAAGAMKMWFESKCDIKSFSLSDPASTSFTKDMSIVTYKGSSVGTCEGNTLGSVWATAVYVKEGDSWRMAFGFNAPA